jgi:hypothetical protein
MSFIFGRPGSRLVWQNQWSMRMIEKAGKMGENR